MQVQEKVRMVDGGVMYKTYTKVKDIGSGSFSKVWLVEAVGSNKLFALKIITKKQLKILESERLIQQVKVHQSLTHSHIVYLDHCFEDDDYKYILLEYCQKGTLDHLFGDRPAQQQDIVRYGKQMIQALIYLHSKGILHRDLKLSNFFLDGDDNIKLGDFGFACKLQYPGQLRRETCGTPNYIAPQVIGGFGYSFPSDIWSLGAILYRLKFGISPFESVTLKETLQNVKLAHYSFPKKTKISQQLQDLITRILCVNYDDRLTLEQISKHLFFTNKSNEPSTLKKQGSFSNFFSKLINRSKSKSKKQGSLHKVDSCGNLRDMKTILREKTLTIDEDAYYNMSSFKPEMKTTFLSPQHKTNSTTSHKSLLPRPKSLLVSQFFSGVMPHEIIQQKQYTVIYLTNGLRQIIHQKNTCIISSQNQYYGKDGKKCQPSKIMSYIIKTYLNPSPIQSINVKSQLQNKNYVTDWKTTGQYLILTLDAASFVPLPRQKLIYLHLKQSQYLYNKNLEVIINQSVMGKVNKIFVNGGSSEVSRLKSPSHKKFLL